MGITKTELYNRIHSRIEFRDLEINEALSEETLCYAGTVVVDGEIACQAKNRGRGGKTSLTAYVETAEGKRDNRITDRHKNLGPLEEIAEGLPPVEGRYGEIEYDPEMIVDFVAGYQDLLNAARSRSRDGYLVFKYEEKPFHTFEYVKQEEDKSDAFLLSLVQDQSEASNEASEEGQVISHVFRDGHFKAVGGQDFATAS